MKRIIQTVLAAMLLALPARAGQPPPADASMRAMEDILTTAKKALADSAKTFKRLSENEKRARPDRICQMATFLERQSMAVIYSVDEMLPGPQSSVPGSYISGDVDVQFKKQYRSPEQVLVLECDVVTGAFKLQLTRSRLVNEIYTEFFTFNLSSQKAQHDWLAVEELIVRSGFLRDSSTIHDEIRPTRQFVGRAVFYEPRFDFSVPKASNE